MIVAALLSACMLASSELQRPEPTWNVPTGAPAGLKHFVLPSRAIGRDVGYNVWLPPSYEKGTKTYPVIYFLHGAGGTENSDAGGFSSLVKAQIEAKAIPEVICVFPNGGMSGYVDRGDIKAETMIVGELIPKIDSEFRTKKNREGRVVCGFSMGGGGAVRLAAKHPDLFSAAAGWAAALNAREESNDVAAIIAAKPTALEKVRFLMIVGDKDLTFASHAKVVDAMKAASLTHTYKVMPGVDHNLGVYYSDTGTEFVRFLTADFTP